MRPRALNQLKIGFACGLVVLVASSVFADRKADDEKQQAAAQSAESVAAETKQGDGDKGPSTRRDDKDGGDKDRGDKDRGDEGRRDGDRRDGDRQMQGSFGRRGIGDNWREQPLPTVEEWEEMETFFRTNSPIRLALYDRIELERGTDAMISQVIRRRLAARFRDLQGMKDRNSDLYDFAFKQMRIEDQILGTLIDIRRQGETKELTDKLREQMSSFVNNSLSEREARLNKLKEFVSREEAGLARDRAERDAIHEKQRERFEREMRRMIDNAAEEGIPTTQPAEAN